MIKGINICLIGVYKPWAGGVSQHIQNLANQIKFSNNIYVITPERFDFIKKERRFWNDGTIKIFQEKIYFSKYPAIQSTIQKTKRALVLSKTIDLYHPHSCYDALVGFIDEKKPLVLTIHGYSSLESLSRGTIRSNSIQYKLIRVIEKKAVKIADAVITPGKNLRNWIINELGANPEKIFHIPNGVDVNRIDEIRNKNNSKSEILVNKLNLKNKRIILFVKALTKQNGILILVKALPLVIKKHKNTHLVIIGKGILKDQIIALAKKLQISNNITILGEINNSQVPIFFNLSEIFAIPFNPLFNFGKDAAGVGDTLGISHLEAMASELPVIGTAIGNLKKAEEELDGAVLYIHPNNPKSLADAIIWLMDNPQQAQKMGEKARKIILKRYTWNIIASQVSDVYKQVLKKN